MKVIRSLSVNLLLFFVALALTVCALEGALRLTRYRYLTGYGNLQENRGFMQADHDAGLDIAPNYPRRTITIEPGYTQAIWSNEIGCFDLPYKGEKEYVLLLGDSFAFGVAPFDCTLGKVTEDLTGTRVLKCGVCGYGPRQELAKARKTIGLTGRVPKAIVLVYFVGNDLADDYTFPSGTVIDGYPIQVRLIDYATGNVITRDQDDLARSVRRLEKARIAPVNLADEALKGDLVGRAKRWLRRNSILHNLMLLTLKKHLLRIEGVRQAGSVLPQVPVAGGPSVAREGMGGALREPPGLSCVRGTVRHRTHRRDRA